MKIPPLSTEKTKKFLSDCYLTSNNLLRFDLVDGSVLFGKLQGISSYFSGENGKLIDTSPAEACFSNDQCVELYYGAPFKEISVFLPLNKIAGITILKLKQKKLLSKTKRWAGDAYDGSIEEILFHNTLLMNAQRLELYIMPHFVMYKLETSIDFFDWGDVSFLSDTAIYSDWSYFLRVSGGINNVGVGTPVASLSIGWSKSLWDTLRNKIESFSEKNKNEGSNSESFLKGHISFFTQKDSTGNSIQSFNMEGAKWFPAAISSKKVEIIDDLKDKDWTLAYFREDAFLFPIELWEKIGHQLVTFGETMATEIKTSVGTKNKFIKARATAYIRNKSEDEDKQKGIFKYFCDLIK